AQDLVEDRAGVHAPGGVGEHLRELRLDRVFAPVPAPAQPEGGAAELARGPEVRGADEGEQAAAGETAGLVLGAEPLPGLAVPVLPDDRRLLRHRPLLDAGVEERFRDLEEERRRAVGETDRVAGPLE